MKNNRNPIKISTIEELAHILSNKKRYKEGLAIWAEDVMIRSYLEDKNNALCYLLANAYFK